MKPILLLLLTCLPLCAATTYPVLSDNTNRTIAGGVTNLSFLNSNSVFTGTARWMGIVTLTNTGNIFVGDGAGLTGVGVATSGGLATNLTATGLTVATGQTNTHLTASSVVVTDANKGIVSGTTTANLATLSANQTFTGTNTFPAASFYPANNIGLRLLWSSPTNIYIPTVAVSSSLTNNGDFVNSTYIGKATLPALLGSNSTLVLVGHILRTNENSTSASIQIFLGSNTNFVGGNSIIATTVGISALNLAGHFLQCANSSTLQIQGSAYANPVNTTMTSFTTTSSPFELYVGAMTTTSHTNLQLIGLKVFEIFAP